MGEGDCDSDTDCEGSLICGRDNCQDFNSNAHYLMDCCHDATDTPTTTPIPTIGKRFVIGMIGQLVNSTLTLQQCTVFGVHGAHGVPAVIPAVVAQGNGHEPSLSKQ